MDVVINLVFVCQARWCFTEFGVASVGLGAKFSIAVENPSLENLELLENLMLT